MNISSGEHGSAIIAKVGEKIERYSLAEPPDPAPATTLYVVP